MRTPPPLSAIPRYPVTAGIAAMAIAVTALASSGRSVDAIHMSVRAFEGEPWRIVTSALPHADAMHLVFNVIWLWVFGTALEDVYGPVRTFAIFVLFAAGSTLAEYALVGTGIGLSGVGYGLFGLLYVLAPRDRRFAGAVDRRTALLFAGWFLLCIGLTLGDVMPIGNVAHGAGALMGFALGLALTRRALAARVASGAGVVAIVVLGLLGSTTFRPLVNMSADGGADSAVIGYDLLGEGRDDEAAVYFERAVAISPKRASSWYNLGVARYRDPPAALAAFRRASALEPDNASYRDAVTSTSERVP